jgi:hypothetical protein
MKYKEYTKAEVKKFCEDHFIEETNWLWNYVKSCKASIKMSDKEVLIVKIYPSE